MADPSLRRIRRVVAPVAATSVARGSVVAFVANGGGVVVGLVTSVIIARSLGPAGKGSYDLAMATATLLSLGLGLSLPGGISYAVARGSADPGALERFLYLFSAGQAMMALVILWVGLSLAPAVVGDFDTGALLAIAAVVGLTSLGSGLRAVLVGRELIAGASWLDLMGRVLAIGTVLAAIAVARIVFSAEVSYHEVLWATAAALGLACGAAWIVLRRVVPGIRGSRGLRSILGFSLPAHLGNLVQFLNYRLDLFLVSVFVGLAAVGVYALAVSLAQMVWLASSAMALAVLPRVAAETSTGTPVTDVARLSRVSLAVSILAAAILAVAGPPFIATVYGARFTNAGAQLLLLLPGIAVFGQANVLAAYIGGVGRQRLNLYIALVALVVTLAFDIALIPTLGGVGAAIASSLSYSTTATLTLVVAARVGSFSVRSLVLVTRQDFVAVGDRIRQLGRL